MERMKPANVLIAAFIATAAAAAATATAVAEVLDATYRGTLVCDKLPFTGTGLREAIEVVIAGGSVRYGEVVRLSNRSAAPEPERGTGTISGQHVELQGAWHHADRKYEAKYAGDFVRRSVRLKGVQTWTVGDKTVTRACLGAVKRPLKPFLPRKR